MGAFNAGDKEKSRFFVRLYADMERSAQLGNYYRKWWVRARALKTWADIVEDHEQCNVHEWTSLYFTYLLKELDEQMIWLQQVFQAENDMAAENLVEMLLDVFKNLDPSLDFCFQAGLKLQSDPLDYLTNIKLSFNQFVQQLEQELFSNPKLQSKFFFCPNCLDKKKIRFQYE